jgi:hypothetical protein
MNSVLNAVLNHEAIDTLAITPMQYDSELIDLANKLRKLPVKKRARHIHKLMHLIDLEHYKGHDNMISFEDSGK